MIYMEKKEQKKKSYIWVVFLVYIALLLGIMALLLQHVSKVLVIYEAAQPAYTIASVADSLSANGVGNSLTVLLPNIAEEDPEEQLPYTIAVTEDAPYTAYETVEDYLAELNAEIAQKGVQYHRELEDYSTGAIRYSLYTGEHRFAETSILPGESETRLKLLTITQWVPQEIRLLREAPKCSVDVTMPAGNVLAINDQPVGEEYILGAATLPGLDYCRRYVDIPDLVSYAVTDLYRLPKVTVSDGDGNILAEYEPGETAEEHFQLQGDHLKLDLQPAEQEMPEERKQYVLDCVETYSLFFSRDLPGATGSTAPIRHLFPADSEYLSLAEEYRRNSMGYFDSHSRTHFVTEEADHYIEYGEDCFCCHVYLEKSMTIYGSREVIDKTDGTYYFVKIDGEWVIADIQ